MYLQKRQKVINVPVLKVTDENSRIHWSVVWVPGAGSSPKFHGYATLAVGVCNFVTQFLSKFKNTVQWDLIIHLFIHVVNVGKFSLFFYPFRTFSRRKSVALPSPSASPSITVRYPFRLPVSTQAFMLHMLHILLSCALSQNIARWNIRPVSCTFFPLLGWGGGGLWKLPLVAKSFGIWFLSIRLWVPC